ncbi:MAG: hypothetical protein Q8858_13380 [Bacteroidota bacterium]|nr:hypothetical protein [Bacteroidota bacterium]
MKTNEDILRYLSGLMSEVEKEKFELELNHSEVLKKEFEKQISLLNKAKVLEEDLSANSPYFNNLLPRVRQRMEKKKRFGLYPRFAFALPIAAVIAYFIINPFSHNSSIPNTEIQQSQELRQTVAQINDETKADILKDIMDTENSAENRNALSSAAVSDSENSEILDNKVADALFDSEEAKVSYLENEDLVGSLSGEETENIYSTLLHKKIL